MNDPQTKEHPVLGLWVAAVVHPENLAGRSSFCQAAVFHVVDQPGKPADWILQGPEITRAHVGPAPAQGSNHGQTTLEGVVAENLAEGELQGAVTTVDDEQVDFLTREIRQGLRHDLGRVGFDVQNIGMTSQKAEQAFDLRGIPPGIQVV